MLHLEQWTGHVQSEAFANPDCSRGLRRVGVYQVTKLNCQLIVGSNGKGCVVLAYICLQTEPLESLN
jgi:hypothetical protein